MKVKLILFVWQWQDLGRIKVIRKSNKTATETSRTYENRIYWSRIYTMSTFILLTSIDMLLKSSSSLSPINPSAFWPGCQFVAVADKSPLGPWNFHSLNKVANPQRRHLFSHEGIVPIRLKSYSYSDVRGRHRREFFQEIFEFWLFFWRKLKRIFIRSVRDLFVL